MEKVKKGLMFLTSIGVAITLTACNDKDDTDNKADTKSESKSEHKSSEPSKSTTNDTQSKQQNENTTNVNQLSERTRLALAFFADNADQYILTKDEALTGVYKTKYGTKEEKRQLYKLVLVKAKNVTNAPSGMNFYQVYPAKGSFVSVIGVSKDKLFIGGTQAALDYKEMQNSGDVYNIKDLYDKNKSYSSLEELAKKIEITDKNPMEDEKTQKQFEANENPNTNAHLRTQVYQMIEKLDGKPIDTDKYLVDNVQMTKSGKWYVHYRNKHAEIVGTYTTENGKVVKKDANGKIVKSKQVNLDQ